MSDKENSAPTGPAQGGGFIGSILRQNNHPAASAHTAGTMVATGEAVQASHVKASKQAGASKTTEVATPDAAELIMPPQQASQVLQTAIGHLSILQAVPTSAADSSSILEAKHHRYSMNASAYLQ
jgi:hypothetical protein